jgi:hypothetical protein
MANLGGIGSRLNRSTPSRGVEIGEAGLSIKMNSAVPTDSNLTVDGSYGRLANDDGALKWYDGTGSWTTLGAAGGGAYTTVALDNIAGCAINTTLKSDADSTDDLGSSTVYWANTYTDRMYLNATAYLDGTLAGRAALTGALSVSGISTLTGNVTCNGDLTVSGLATLGTISLSGLACATAVITNNAATTTTIAAITSTSLTTGKALSITANTVDTGSLVYLETSAAGFTGKYLQCYDGAADDFSVGLYGATIIAGNASTDVLTITAGDLQITAGDIDLDLGIIAVDNTADEANNISRNNGTGTSPVLTVGQSNAAGGKALFVDQNSTTAGHYGLEIDSEGGTCVHFSDLIAAGKGILVDVANSWTGQHTIVDAGPWLGTLNRGAALDFRSDSGAVAEVGSVIYVKLGGTSADAAAINGKGLYIEDEAATTAGSYLVNLDSANNGSLHITKGTVVINDTVNLQIGTSTEFLIQNTGTSTHATLAGNFTVGDGGSTNYTSFTSATGKISFAGSACPTKTLWIPAQSFSLHTGAAALGLLAGTMGSGWAMDAAADEAITTSFRVPDNWKAASDATIYLYWAANDATGGKKCYWEFTSVPLAEDELTTGAGNVDTMNDTEVSSTAWDLNVSAGTTITASTEWAAGDYVFLKVMRDADHASDDLAVDAYVIGVRIDYTASQI